MVAAWMLALASVASAAATPPYPRSQLITDVTWDFSTVTTLRKAHGSDIWPLTWAADGNLYGAWGDGGGFDGDSDGIGRVSLGFARISGTPVAGDTGSYAGKNVWGAAPRFAEHQASFGGKVDSLLSVGGTLYGNGNLRLGKRGVHRYGGGRVQKLIWSDDLGKSWHVARWTTRMSLGAFLNFGADYAGAPDSYVYLYYQRIRDTTCIYLKRVPVDKLKSNPDTTTDYQYLTGMNPDGTPMSWSIHPVSARPIFCDPNQALSPDAVYDPGIGRFLLTAGHTPPGRKADESAGHVGLFEAPNPWGPWATVGYYDDWGHFGPAADGEFMSLHLPTKWMSADGTVLWGVFTSVHAFDSFNVVKATLTLGDPTRP